MDNKQENTPNDEKEVEKNTSDESKDFAEEPDNITREINLDELYDGAVNNTVVIDPVTNDEVFLPSKKPNYTSLGVVLAVIILLVLYYVNNKTDFGGTTKDVEPKTTSSSSVINSNENKTGTLTCTYNSKSDAETQTVTFVANYENNVLKNSNFNYVVVANLENTSAVIEDLKNQYENFYINNAAVIGSNTTFEKNDKGFTFNSETNYDSFDFDKLVVNEGQTILYVKPQKTDTYESLQEAYVSKGFNCTLSDN